MNTSVNWETRYQNYKDVWGIEPEYTLTQYEGLVDGGKVLDIGIGEGRNVLRFGLKGNFIEGIDISETAIKRCEEMFHRAGVNFDLHCCDVNDFIIRPSEYSFIISAWTMNFLKRSDMLKLIANMKTGVKSGGLIYIGLFSKADPMYLKYRGELQEVEMDTFYLEARNTFVSYIDRETLVAQFDDAFEIVTIKEDFSLDIGHGEPHYHGGLELIVRKK